ncbi:hypothetical protein SBRCBS47491_009452 [Sporothrix bragantina]|uniref:Zn(2)-C6 fungal-type domain-containing protein n=1 Tax=Sporothrix bragantina TaxID=671064 RepID=A0ABP0CUT2_9PEZI
MSQYSQLSCWTCRLRKKKCDRSLPVCSNCCDLGISCRNGDDKRPQWMDGGEAQEKHTLVIRAQIKEHQVRERSLAAQLRKVQKRQRQADEESKLQREAWGALATREKKQPDANQSQSTQSSLSSRTAVPQSAPPTVAFESPTQSYISADFIVMYLDYVFPFLFPHYRPTVFEGGRAWVLATLQTQKPLYHTAMSLASYFLALITQTPTQATTQSPSNTATMAEPYTALKSVCGRYIWDILGDHMDEASRAVRAVIDSIPREPFKVTLVQRTRLLVNIVQLQVFEISMGGTTAGTRGIHLRAATEEFNSIFQEHDSLDNILAELDHSYSGSLQGPGWRIWNIDQAAFRFAAIVLLYMDIVDSTTRQAAPHLRKWHPKLIEQADENAKDSKRLRMEDVVGCQGWMLMLISEIAVLANWTSKGTDLLNRDTELHARAQSILWHINNGLKHLVRDTDSANSPHSTSASASSPAPYMKAYYRPDGGTQLEEQACITRIWAHAGLLYLETFTRKCACNNCSSKSHNKNVTTILQLLQQVSSPAVLRGLIWPIFVTGIMASVDQRETIRAVIDTAGPLQKFGGLASTLQHLEELWNRQPPQHDELTRSFRDSASLLPDCPIFM